ncbi:MAG TPA: phosphopantetheine-binding protein [Gaiellaceae bacterium]|nr:phosphopantetheine-binding protein [Gaiellaceae bacterium]
MSTDRTAQRIRQLMTENLTYSGSWSEVDEDYPLLAKHVIDSLGMLKLVSLIEEDFDVEIDDDDVVPDNWRTIRHIATLVESKRSPSE